jgi:type IV secretion system protein VirB4
MDSQIEECCAVVMDTLADYGPQRLGVRRHRGVSYSEIAEAARLCLYARWSPVPVPAGRLSDVIYSDRVICGLRGFEIRGAGGSSFGLMFGLLDYIERVPPRLLDPLLAMRGRWVMVNSFHCLTRGRVADRLGLRERQMRNAEDRAVSLTEGLGDAMDEVSSGRGLMGDHHFLIAVHVDRHADLDAAASRMRAALVNAGIPITAESWGCEAAFWSQVPGGSAWLRARHGAISGYNFASFSSLSGEPSGGGRGHWGAPILRLCTAP